MKEFIKNKLAGRTQRWLCTNTGITDVVMSNCLNGHNAFSKEEWDKVALALSLSKKEKAEATSDYQFRKLHTK